MTLDEQLVAYQSQLMSFFMKKTSSDKELSEDLYQELFIKVRKKVSDGNYIEEGKFINWLKRVAANLVIDHYRRESRIKLVTPNEEVDIFHFLGEEDEPYEDTWVTEEMADKLQDAIETLPKKQQELIHMRYYRNMSYKEIVLETGEKQVNLLPRMFYAMDKLKKILC